LKDCCSRTRITGVRRLIAGLAAALVLGITVFPAVAATCCVRAPAHSCCAKKVAGQRELGRAPCCKASLPAKHASREQAAPRVAASPGATPIAQPASFALLFDVGSETVPSCVLAPSPPPLGPPLRLRI
jgi:hypothetical protein